MPSSNTGTNAAALAETLSSHTHQIANLEDAADCYRDIQNLIERIEHTINRPTPPRYCGNCPTDISKYPGTGPITCAQPLYAKPTDIAVTCWQCKTTHNIEQLIQNTLKQAPLIFTSEDILTIMHNIGETIPDRTWRHWRHTGRIKPAGQLYGQPAYKLADARQLRAQTKTTPK